jgi:tetratricopeptide (TPR) repeat protein
MPDNTNFYNFRLRAAALRWMPVSFAVVAPLALMGFMLAQPRWRRGLPLYVLVLAHFVVLMSFFVVDRFRMPMAAAMIPFAGLTLDRLAEYLASRRWRPAAAVTAGIIVLWLAIAQPFAEARPLIRTADWRAPYRVYYDPLCVSAQEAGNWQEAADIYAESLKILPPEIIEMGPWRPARDADEAEMSSFYSRVYYVQSQLLLRCGRTEDAAAEYRRAVELDQASRVKAFPETR